MVAVLVARAIAEVLPFTIHFDELGRHTLYVTVQEGLPGVACVGNSMPDTALRACSISKDGVLVGPNDA